jgi:elongation factor G
MSDEPLLIGVPVESKLLSDRNRLAAALDALSTAGLPFSASFDQESGQAILNGASERDLETLVDIVIRIGRIDLKFGALQIACRETLSEAVIIKYTHKKQMAGSGEFASVTIEFEPLRSGSGFVFENRIVDGSIPNEFISSVEKGLKAQKEGGLLAGFPVVDFKAALVGGIYHEIDSNALTFEIAARAAFRELASKNVARLLQPVMKVSVLTPDDFLGGIVGDLNSRGGTVQGTDSMGDAQIVTARVPLGNMIGYLNTLMSMTQGRAHFVMRFDHYETVESPDGDGNNGRFPPAMAMRA